MNRVDEKIALVSGGGSGLGQATCEILAEAGAKVAVTDINEDSATKVAEGIVKKGGQAVSFALDTTQEADWKRVIGKIMEVRGKLDIVINNAGIAQIESVETSTLEQWRHLMAINLDGVFLGTKYAIEAMKKGDGGSIVNISSIEGIVGEPLACAYNASKGGVRIFTKSVALHCAAEGYNIRVNSVHPGFIATPMVLGLAAQMPPDENPLEGILERIPMGRLADAIEVARAVLFLASSDSSYMTGSELVIDGGFTAR